MKKTTKTLIAIAAFLGFAANLSAKDVTIYVKAAAVKLELITKDYGVPFISDHYPVAFSFIMN